MGLIGEDEKTAHILVIPLTTHGHMTPTLRLAKQLGRKGIAITFVSFKDEISRLTSADSSSELQSLGFELIGLDNPVLDETDPFIQNLLSIKLNEAFKPVMEKLVHNKRSGIAGPTCILSDMFLPWTQDIAEALQIPRYMFVTSGVIYAKFLQSYEDLLGHRLVISERDGQIENFDGSVDIPGLFPLRYHEFPPSSVQYPAIYRFTSNALLRSRGVLANSYYELEEQMIETWTMPGASAFEHTKVYFLNFCSRNISKLALWEQGPKIYPVGPLFSTSTTIPDVKVIRGLEDSAPKSLLWLGSQPASSVLYIAFGTEARLSQSHILELALGLEGSNQRFLWVLPLSTGASSITDVLPPGFEARVGDRACIVSGWVPQLQILAHSATAAFLTHCGWNSTVESVMNGVPMISWPQSADQHINCRYLVDHLKVAIQLQTGPENILKRKEVEIAVRLLMVESEGKAIRRRVEDLQRKGAAAVAEGGSKSRILQELVDDIELL